MERKLATIAKINDINPIKGADVIEVATIRGWKVVVKKDEFKIGDLCVYCEIDSVMPPKEEFKFLENKKYRIKTIKLRGQVSQGIAFPLSILPLGWHSIIDQDVTELLEVIKWEPVIPACLAGKIKGHFPSHSLKTDEERIQNLIEEFPNLKTKTYIATEKLDGSSATFYLKDNIFGVCSRNLDILEDDTNSFWKVARELKIEELMRENGLDNYNLQGELIGEGIQKNKYRIKGQTVRFFRMFNIKTHSFINYSDFILLIKAMELQTVPIVEVNLELPETIDELLKYAEGLSKLNKNIQREGIVFVAEETEDRESFKVISNKFLLKNE